MQRGVWGNFPRYNTEISAGRQSKEVAKPLPLLLSPASTPPVRRPRQRPLPDQRSRESEVVLRFRCTVESGQRVEAEAEAEAEDGVMKTC